MWDKGAKWGWFMTWYDYDYNEGKSTTHRHTDAEWWQAAWDSGLAVDRTEMKQLLADIKDGVHKPQMVNGKSLNSEWYDLSGRKVANGQWPTAKGIYIVNGKKVAIK
jgi:hypothetical protein